MKKWLLISLLALSGIFVYSQDYDQSIGLRLGLTNGIAYKASLDGVSAIEVIGSFKSRETTLTGLYEIHFYSFDINNLYLVAGVGGHMGVVAPRTGTSYLVIGVDGIVGIEYALPRGPFAFTLDVKPALNLIGRNTLDIGWLGLTARYTF